ncbi:MAG: prepilin-type N-terminal cleavage/methylation domain-containing protein [Rickettsiales bacterium]|nr:prepilin-type N-terminal cleavage/methylation domain-containing protein [Pseudomonadota bacterium]MDA0965547.1 prepilin-type N-terminal cleavage/methylation domain-containing protein [Pseudomonadota bacterium]MDG4542871.1 prepilin-type N-terminal cleavage/methylation domain-containing protein [Rickettsiales bacterium]MDG4544681.1 prepilin-type N-terminal cleavage/methylation domain-containing protein [Rickettsiales bacterium]MDG4546803.1 prepilin-type N-terminal cleavage/methylation domain-c
MNGNPKHKGFTLIELSIVIVIIGLIVAGIVGGQAIVTQAKLRSVISDIDKYKIAINTFQLEYNALPGDLANAESYFGAASTNNGNGNRRIDNYTSATNNEQLLLWQHLSLAKIISGTYSGVGDGSPNNATPVINVPTAFGGKNCFGFRHNTVGIGWISPRPPSPSPFLIVGRESSDGVELDKDCVYSGFTTADAFSIDKKIDDGLSHVGLIFSFEGKDSGAAANC